MGLLGFSVQFLLFETHYFELLVFSVFRVEGVVFELRLLRSHLVNHFLSFCSCCFKLFPRLSGIFILAKLGDISSSICQLVKHSIVTDDTDTCSEPKGVGIVIWELDSGLRADICSPFTPILVFLYASSSN